MIRSRVEDATAYEVLARSAPGADLTHIGVVFASNTALASTYARWLYDEESWSEMYIVPRDELIAVESRRSQSAGRGRSS